MWPVCCSLLISALQEFKEWEMAFVWLLLGVVEMGGYLFQRVCSR